MNIPQCNAIFWKSQTQSVNESIYDFDWVSLEIPVKIALWEWCLHVLLFWINYICVNVQILHVPNQLLGIVFCFPFEINKKNSSTSWHWTDNEINIYITQASVIMWLLMGLFWWMGQSHHKSSNWYLDT